MFHANLIFLTTGPITPPIYHVYDGIKLTIYCQNGAFYLVIHLVNGAGFKVDTIQSYILNL